MVHFHQTLKKSQRSIPALSKPPKPHPAQPFISHYFCAMNTVNRTIAPKIHDAIDFEFTLPPINTSKLDNGIPFYWFSGGVQEVVEVDWVFPAGLWQEPKAAVALACGGLLKNGTSQKTAHQIHEAIEFFGANLQISTGDDYTVISLFCLTKDLPLLLPIVQEMLNDAQFPEEELALYKQNAVQRLMVSLLQCDFVANQRIDTLLYGEDHPYGRYSKVEKIEALNREDLTAFYKENFDLGKTKIFMAGKLGNTEIALINKFFGTSKVLLTATENTKIIKPGVAAIGQKFREINDANGVQAAIRIAREFPNRHHPDFPKMVILNTLFGGYFGSRLMNNIREEKGYTYGIHSSIQPRLHGGALTIHTEVGRDVMEPAIIEIYKEMALLCDQPAEAEELLLVKNYLLGGLLGDLDGPFQIVQRWRSLILNDLDEAHFYTNVAVYKAITPSDIQMLAQQYFQAKDFVEIAVV